MKPLRILFAGAGEFGLPTLRTLIAAGHSVITIISQPDRPAGRGRVLTPTSISKLAIDRNLPLIRTSDINSEILPPADAMVVIAFGQKIAPHIVDHPYLGSVNLHSSLLPKYRGAAPINAAVINGDRTSGNSVIRLAQKMDAGAILGQVEVEIGETETAGELHDRLADVGAPLVLRVLDEMQRGVNAPREQDHAQATIAPKLSRESTIIDWLQDAQTIANQIRGMFPWPSCRVSINDGASKRHLTLVRAQPAATSSAQPGTLDASGLISAGKGAVDILEVQPEGKRPMPLAAYRNGHPWRAGMRVESVV